jgi:hypothetical protein
MDNNERYREWLRDCFAAIRANIPREAGSPSDEEGQYENVGFQISPPYDKRIGNEGG